MFRFCIFPVALWCAISWHASAQEKLPSRFDPLAKNDRFRIARVLGMPEVQPTLLKNSAISADGKWAIYAEDLSSGEDDKPRLRTRLLLYDLQAKTWPREFDIDVRNVSALDLSRDGGKVLLAGETLSADKNEEKGRAARACLVLFDLQAGKALRTIETMDSYFQCVALAPDELAALTGSAEKLKKWNLKQDEDVVVYDRKEAAPIAALAYLPGGKQFLAGYHGGEVCLWSVGLDKSVRTFGSKDPKSVMIWDLAVSQDGKRFAAADMRAAVTLWEIESGKEIGKIPAEKRTDPFITGLAIAGDGKTVFAAWGESSPVPFPAQLVAWDADSKKTLWSKATGHLGLVPMLVQKDKLLIGGGSNLFETWSVKEGKKIDSWGGHRGPVSTLAVLPNGDILSAGQDGEMLTWQAGKIIRRQVTDGGAVNVVAQSKDRKHWLSAAIDHAIRLHAAEGQKPLHVLKGHTGPITSLAFGNAGWAASGSDDRTAKTWNLQSGKEIASFAGHSEGVNAVAVAPDDRWLATGSSDTTIKLWPINAGKLDPDRETITLEGHKKPVTCLAFSADGKTLISGSQDQTLKVWDWAKEKAIRTIPGHKNWITSLLLVDAKTAVTTSDDLSLCWWDLDSGKELGRLDFGAVGDCPRCLAPLGPDRVLVGTSSWLIFDVQLLAARASRAP